MIIELTIAGVLFLGLVCLGIWAYTSDQKIWNNGQGPNGKWKLVTMDSQGGRLYSDGKVHTWISWPVDKVKK